MASKNQRVAAHTHIKGLGLTADGTALDFGSGLVGQKKAREALGIVVDLIRRKQLGGRGLLLAGAPGSGKTALALAVAAELGSKVPFCPMVGSEVYSSEVKKTEILAENFRRAIALRMREVKEVWEGEITMIQPVDSTHNLAGYGRTISHVKLGLRSAKGTVELKLDPSVYENITKERVAVGDIIHIEANTGAVVRMGRCDEYANEYDIEQDEYVPLPRGEVHRKKEVIQNVTLHDLDLANAKPKGGNDAVSVLTQALKPRKTEITEKLRSEVNKTVNGYLDSGLAELVPGVLFIDEAHMLDVECFAFLNRALESSLAPIVIFATNRGNSTVRGTNTQAPHGISLDLIDRLMIVRTLPYSVSELRRIVQLRTEIEMDVRCEESTLDELSKLGSETSLRYVLSLLGPISAMATASGKDSITSEDVRDAAAIFLDAKRSAKILFKNKDKYLS